MLRKTILAACAAAAIVTIGAAAQAQRRPQIILYQEDNFRGAELAVDGPVTRLSDLRFEDRASSVRVLSGSWELCDKDGFGGRCVTITRDVNKLNSLAMDDRASSVRPLNARSDDRSARGGGRNDGGRNDGGGIRVVSGTYGGATCRQPRGNRTADLAAACDGNRQCRYTIDVRTIGDPSFGCAKDYVAEWTCGTDRALHTTRVAPEADRQNITLDCR